MAKLPPPTIAGSLPSFYKSENGTTKLVVPFSMNKMVSIAAIKQFSLRIKTTNTDILYGVLSSDNWNPAEWSSPEVSFDVPDMLLSKLTIGNFYKVQLAYVDTDDITGYYSTVGIIKFTSKPKVEISGFDRLTTNINETEFVGIYYNKNDSSEKAYQYRFDLYDLHNKLIETSGWIIHNSYEDTSLIESHDRYILKYDIGKDVTYRIQYAVKTNNGLIVKSPKYLIMNSLSIDPEVKAKLIAELDYNNACININLIGEKAPSGVEYAITGTFLLTRSSSLDNYSTWLPITRFKMTGELPSAFLFKDYTIEQGATYLYSLQQCSDYNKIYSNRLLTEKINVSFDDAFLFDGVKQLKIRFNPKISSFKTVLMETKKNTIGGKYPFIFRNGAVEYKEFPISGLISYLMDEDEFFISKKDDFHISKWQDTTDITDENVMLERLFKLRVLDWLNDGKPKLFKSPQEGNYIVRLTNTSLTPNDTLSRMLHTFSCTATEIADFTSDNLIKYELINADEIVTYQMRWETIILQDKYREYLKQGKSIFEQDLLNGYEAYSIKITDAILGTKFSFVVNNSKEPQTIMIGATGAYEITLDKPITNLKILSNNNSNFQGSSQLLQGSITFSIYSSMQNKFDKITNVVSRDIICDQYFGPNENILSYWQNIKRKISRIYYCRFSKLDVIEVNNTLFGQKIEDEKNSIYLTGVVETLQNSTAEEPAVYDIQTIDENGQIIHNYYRYYNGAIYSQPHFSTVFKVLGVINPYTLYKGYNERDDKYHYYRLHNEQLIEDDSFIHSITGNEYTISYTDLTPYVVYKKRYYDKDSLKEEYYKYTGSKLIQLNDYSTKIEYGNVILDVADKQEVYITELSNMPDKISIGSGVCAEIGLQVKYIDYSVEKYCKDKKDNYENALKNYMVAVFGLETISKDDVKKKINQNTTNPDTTDQDTADQNITNPNTTNPDTPGQNTPNQNIPDQDTFFVWENNNFRHLDKDEIINEYLKRDVIFYHPILDGFASQSNIDDLYSKLLESEVAFLEAIQPLLDAQENGVT